MADREGAARRRQKRRVVVAAHHRPAARPQQPLPEATPHHVVPGPAQPGVDGCYIVPSLLQLPWQRVRRLRCARKDQQDPQRLRAPRLRHRSRGEPAPPDPTLREAPPRALREPPPRPTLPSPVATPGAPASPASLTALCTCGKICDLVRRSESTGYRHGATRDQRPP